MIQVEVPGGSDQISNRQCARGIDFDRDVFCLMGLPIDAAGMDDAVRLVRHAAQSHSRCFVSTPNLNFVIAAQHDVIFRDSLVHSDLSLADGMPLVWVALLLGVPIRSRVSGAGLFEQLECQTGTPVTVFFFGGPAGAAEAACIQVNRRSGGLKCVGFEAPGYGSLEGMSDPSRIDKINRSGAQFVVVALGAKKGQAWIEHNRASLRAPVLCHLGAVVNFSAGTLRRAPTWVQQVGAEWIWRISQEPNLLPRYWSDGVSFLAMLLCQVLPLAVHLRIHAPSRDELERASIAVFESQQQTTFEMRGAWTHANLTPLRRALSRAIERSATLVIDLTSVSYVDSAFLGLLMLAHGAWGGARRFALRGASPRVANVFKQCGVAFMLDGCE